MLKSFFINKINFSVIFFAILLLDVFVKVCTSDLSYRYFTKPLVLIFLIIFYYLNVTYYRKRVNKNVFFALIFFLLGDFFILNSSNTFFLFSSILFFAIGKIFLCLKFKNKEDFEYSRLRPFSIAIYIFITFIILMIYKNLRMFFIPGMLSFFISLLMLNLAYLRKEHFTKWSYFFVLLGCLLFVLIEGVNAISTFNNELPFPYFFIMIFYGISMYLIVLGIVIEEQKKNSVVG